MIHKVDWVSIDEESPVTFRFWGYWLYLRDGRVVKSHYGGDNKWFKGGFYFLDEDVLMFADVVPPDPPYTKDCLPDD